MGQWIGINGPNILKYVLYSKSIPPLGANRGQFVSQKFDLLIEKALASSNRQEIYQYYKEAQRVANEEIAYINLWHPNILWIGRNCLSNVKLFPSGSAHPLKVIQNNCVD
jgi:peptide/nickel transport system substrate-binding protein